MGKKTFPGVFDSLVPISDFIVAEATGAGLTEQAIYQVQLAVDEACSNIIEHAYREIGDGKIHITCSVKSDGLEIVLKDHGKPFDPDKVPEPKVGVPLEELGSRGAGLFLMRKLMDDIHFEFDEKSGTTLRMFKKKSG